MSLIGDRSNSTPKAFIPRPNRGYIEFQENLIKSKYLAREGNQITGKLYAKYNFNVIILPLHDRKLIFWVGLAKNNNNILYTQIDGRTIILRNDFCHNKVLKKLK